MQFWRLMISPRYALPVAFFITSLSLFGAHNRLERLFEPEDSNGFLAATLDGDQATLHADGEWTKPSNASANGASPGHATRSSHIVLGINTSADNGGLTNILSRSEIGDDGKIAEKELLWYRAPSYKEALEGSEKLDSVVGDVSSLAGASPTLLNGSMGENAIHNCRAFRLTSEEDYCNASNTFLPNFRRCLVPKYPNGTHADIVDVPRDEVQLLLGDGSAFAMFANATRIRWWGRTFNSLKQVYSAIVAARACGKMVLLPRKVNYPRERKKAGFGSAMPSSYVDCVDFRRAPVPEPYPHFDRDAFCNLTAVLADIDRSHSGKLSVDSLSSYWHNGRDYRQFPLPPQDFFDSARVEAKKATLTYWGIRPGSYRCRPCPAPSKERVVAYLRGEDLFKRNVSAAFKGQPPLDFYVRAIRHARAKVVTLVSSDRRNPVLGALQNYNWTSDGGEQVRIITRIGDPYEIVLYILFCASVLILGNTSMGPLAVFAPNAKAVYMGRTLERWRNDYADQPDWIGTTPRETAWNIPNERNTPSLLAKLSDEMKVYGYLTKSNYTPYQRWRNTAEQRSEMKSYQNGTLFAMN